MCAWKNEPKSFQLEGQEKTSFENFLGGQQFKNVSLDKVLGIGGQGVVIQKELEIKVMEGTESDNGKKAENIRKVKILESEGTNKVAVKFVKFEKDDGENFEGQGLIIQA